MQILGSGGTIVWVMLLSTVFLRAKYRLIHFAGVSICLLGIGVLAYADIHNGKSLEGRILLYVYLYVYVCYMSMCCVSMNILRYLRIYVCMCN